MRRVLLLVVGGIAALVGVVLARESRMPPERRDRWARRLMNERVNPILARRGIAGRSRMEIGLIEHVGRVSGTLRRTPVHPIRAGERIAIPLPYGPRAAWPRNVIEAGRCRLEYRGDLYELATPRAVDASEIEALPRLDRLIGRTFGGRFLILDVVAVAPGTLGPAEPTIAEAPEAGAAAQADAPEAGSPNEVVPPPVADLTDQTPQPEPALL